MKKNFFLNKDVIYSISLLGYLGFLFIGNILLYIFIYKLIEKYYMKSTILFIIFIFIGLVSAFYNVYKVIMKK